MDIKSDRLRIGTTPVAFNKSPNVGGALKPKFLIIHYTASGPSSNIADYFAKPAAKVSAHLVIRRDGTIIQCVPFDVVGWHAGKSTWTGRDGKKYTGLNQSSIGIEIENWGPLSKSGSGWVSWTGQPVDASKVIEAQHKHGGPTRGWEIFTEAQIEASLAAAEAIVEEYGIEEILGHEDIARGRKTDPGPAFNMASFNAKVYGRDSDDDPQFVVRSPTGLNIRTGPGAGFPTVKPNPLPDGTRVSVHEVDGSWRFVSVLNGNGDPDFSGWVHGNFIRPT